MLCRIREIRPLQNYCLSVIFDDGKYVIYDVKEDIRDLPGYHILRDVHGLFQQVQLDPSRTCVYWTDEVDLPSDAIYEFGADCNVTKDADGKSVL